MPEEARSSKAWLNTLPASSEVAATQCDEEMWAYVCSAAVSRRLVLKRPADFPSSACFGQWGIEISRVWLLNFPQLCANLTRLVDFADQKKHMAVQRQGTAMYQLSSFRLIACELIMACLFIVSAQVMMLVYGTWTTDMPRSKKVRKATEDYIYIWTETYIIGFLYICRKHITISPYDHTHNHALTYTHYMYTDTHNMNTAHIHHHNIA